MSSPYIFMIIKFNKINVIQIEYAHLRLRDQPIVLCIEAKAENAR